MTPLDPDRALALTYVPSARRAAIAALWQLDAAMGAVLAGGREPMISRIKLAWWRDSLEKLDHDPPPSEPLLQAVAQHVLPAGVSGTEVSAMEGGWAALLDPEALNSDDMNAYAAGRGGLLFRHSATLLRAEAAPQLSQAGESWALVDLARRTGNEEEAEAALAAARRRPRLERWPVRLRPLGMLSRLALRDAERGAATWEPHGAPSRMLAMLAHRLTGR